MNEHFDKAVAYVRENRGWTDHYRCSIDFASPQIHSEICNLMDEYGEENGLPEDWWREFGDEDDVFFAIN